MALAGSHRLFHGWWNNRHLAPPSLHTFNLMKMETTLSTDFEVSSSGTSGLTAAEVLKYSAAGTYFGIVLSKAEVISWFRIQEMFLFQSFHMYGVIGSAVVVGALSVWLIRRFRVRSGEAQPALLTVRAFHKGTVAGGLIFGIGWAFTGACPGPVFAQVGAGYLAGVVVLLSALAGTYVYGLIRHKLPH
jgi:hypothetical protein